MTPFETATLITAVLAIIISIYTAYKTFFPKAVISVFIRSRCFLTKTETQPSIVVGVDISNIGNKPTSIEDMYLAVKYIQKDTDIDKSSIVSYQKGTSISKTHPFFPVLTREDYSVVQTYQSVDFEMFNTILVPGNTRFAKYIVFMPTDGFTHFSGDMELVLFYRIPNEKEWRKAQGQSRFPVEERFMKIWQDPQGRTLITQSIETEEIRNHLLSNNFKTP